MILVNMIQTFLLTAKPFMAFYPSHFSLTISIFYHLVLVFFIFYIFGCLCYNNLVRWWTMRRLWSSITGDYCCTFPDVLLAITFLNIILSSLRTFSVIESWTFSYSRSINNWYSHILLSGLECRKSMCGSPSVGKRGSYPLVWEIEYDCGHVYSLLESETSILTWLVNL